MQSASTVPRRRFSGLGLRAARGLGVATKRVVGAVSFPARLVNTVVGRFRGRVMLQADNGPYAHRNRTAESSDDLRPRLDGVESERGLAHALMDPDPDKRALALEVICEFSRERAARLLNAMLHDPEPSVRVAAANAAARVRAPGVVFSLILCLEDPNAEVRSSAAFAFEQTAGKHIDTPKLDDPKKRDKIVQSLRQWWKDRRFEQLAADAGL